MKKGLVNSSSASSLYPQRRIGGGNWARKKRGETSLPGSWPRRSRRWRRRRACPRIRGSTSPGGTIGCSHGRKAVESNTTRVAPEGRRGERGWLDVPTALCRPCRGWYSRLQVHGLAPEATFCRPVRGCSAAPPDFRARRRRRAYLPPMADVRIRSSIGRVIPFSVASVKRQAGGRLVRSPACMLSIRLGVLQGRL
jgi:hypothetical protein